MAMRCGILVTNCTCAGQMKQKLFAISATFSHAAPLLAGEWVRGEVLLAPINGDMRVAGSGKRFAVPATPALFSMDAEEREPPEGQGMWKSHCQGYSSRIGVKSTEVGLTH